jgi:hypothetical protein
VDENPKVGTLCPTFDTSVHQYTAGLLPGLNIILQPGKLEVDARTQRVIPQGVAHTGFFNVSAEMTSVPTFCAGKEWFKLTR